MDGKPLPSVGTYPAALCCNLITKQRIRLGVGKQQTLPRITERGGETILKDLTAGTKAVYKYFDLRNTKRITVESCGNAALSVNGVRLDHHGTAPIKGGERETLCIEVLSGKADVLSFTLEE